MPKFSPGEEIQYSYDDDSDPWSSGIYMGTVEWNGERIHLFHDKRTNVILATHLFADCGTEMVIRKEELKWVKNKTYRNKELFNTKYRCLEVSNRYKSGPYECCRFERCFPIPQS